MLNVSNDLINGCFELLGALMLLNNCRAVWRDRDVKGVSIPATAFFAGWGLWNLHYYPSLGQWFSFSGGVALTLANLLWITLMMRFRCSPS